MAIDLNTAISPSVAKYFQAKMEYDPRILTATDTETAEQRALRNMNHVLQAKGGQQIVDLSQADAAFAPLIAKRNKRGIGGIGGMLLPIAAGFLAGPLGTALAGGLGIGTTAATALAGAGLGGLSGALTGQNVLKSAALGGVSGGFQGATAGKVLATSGPLKGQLVTPGVSSAVASSGPLAGQVVSPSIGSGIGSNIGSFSPGILDKAASLVSRTGSQITGLGDKVTSALGLPTSSGPIAPTIGGAENAIAGSTAMKNPLMTALSGYQQYQTQSDIEDELKMAQMQAQSAINPYANSGLLANKQLSEALSAGFNPGDLAADPGYQFRLGEGQKQLEQSLAARGMGQSGAALKAAQEYGQNFANQEYNDAFRRWISENQQLAGQSGQGLNAAGAMSDIYGNIGNIGANATAGKNNALMGTLSSILGGGRNIIGFDAMGNPIYG